jgi:hypothetical protein
MSHAVEQVMSRGRQPRQIAGKTPHVQALGHHRVGPPVEAVLGVPPLRAGTVREVLHSFLGVAPLGGQGDHDARQRRRKSAASTSPERCLFLGGPRLPAADVEVHHHLVGPGSLAEEGTRGQQRRRCSLAVAYVTALTRGRPPVEAETMVAVLVWARRSTRSRMR